MTPPDLNSDSEHAPDGYVLVVDDDPDVRALHAAAFRRASMEVVEAADGLAALHTIRARLPAVIVTDAQMPEMDGLALARAVRDDGRTRGAFIVMVSSSGGSTAFDAEAREAGCDMVFGKPCSLVVLESVVSAHMTSSRREGAPARR
jgi:DNA-binding response OmpR family regulator